MGAGGERRGESLGLTYGNGFCTLRGQLAKRRQTGTAVETSSTEPPRR